MSKLLRWDHFQQRILDKLLKPYIEIFQTAFLQKKNPFKNQTLHKIFGPEKFASLIYFGTVSMFTLYCRKFWQTTTVIEWILTKKCQLRHRQWQENFIEYWIFEYSILKTWIVIKSFVAQHLNIFVLVVILILSL